MQEEHGARIRVVAVNVADDDHQAIRKFARQLDLPYTILVDGKTVFREDYKGKSMPHTYIIDAEGKIVYAHAGFDDKALAKMKQTLAKLLDG